MFSGTFHQAAFVLTVTLSQLVTVAQISVVAYPGEIIAKDFDDDHNGENAWFLAAYALTSGVFVLATGSLGDYLGHRWLFLFGWCWTGLWSLISSFASSSAFFCVCRALAGIGSACLSPAAVALLGRAFPPASKPKNISLALLGAFAPAGYVFGGVFGALLAQEASWRWALRLLAFISFALACSTVCVVPKCIGGRAENATLHFDWLGALLGIASLVLLSYAFNEGAVAGWERPFVYVPLIVAAALLVVFFLLECRNTDTKLFPATLLQSKNFVPVVASMLLGWMSFGIWLYYTTIFPQKYRGQTPLGAVAEMVALAPMGVVATACVGIFAQRVHCQWIFGAAMLAFFVGNLLMALTPRDQMFWRMMFPATLLVPFGPDLSFASAAIILSDAVPAADQGAAGGVVSTVVLYAVSLGLGIASTADRYVTASHDGDHFKGQRAAYWIAAAMAASALLIVLFFVRDTRKLVKSTVHDVDRDDEEAKGA